MSLPPAPPPASTTVSVGLPPRKSALKKMPDSTSTFRTHLPPPEFADQSPTNNFMMETTSSFRTLQHHSNRMNSPVVTSNQPQHSHNTQTLPLKSNLKKSGSSGSKPATLQWSASTTVEHHPRPPSAGSTGINRVSLEELRV